MDEIVRFETITDGVGGAILWEAKAPSMDGWTRVLLERDDNDLLWMTTIYPDLIRPGATSSISVNITEEDLTRLSFTLTAGGYRT